MLFLILLLVFIAAGIFIGVLFNRKVNKDNQVSDKKEINVITVLVFTAAIIISYVVLFAGINVNNKVKKYSVDLEHYIKTSPDLAEIDFVQNGIDMVEVNKNINSLNNSINELKEKLWTSHAKDLGVPRFMYDAGADYLLKEIKKRLMIVNTAGEIANTFADENNYLTVSSIMKGLRKGISSVVNAIMIICILICIVFVGIYILVTLSAIKKEKAKLADITPQTEEEIQAIAKARAEAEAQAKAFK